MCEKSFDEILAIINSFMRLNEGVSPGGTDVNRDMDCSSVYSPKSLRTMSAFCFIRKRSRLCFPPWSLVLQRRQEIIPPNTQNFVFMATGTILVYSTLSPHDRIIVRANKQYGSSA